MREWATAYAGFLRPTVWDRAVTPELAGVPLRLAMVGAEHAPNDQRPPQTSPARRSRWPGFR